MRMYGFISSYTLDEHPVTKEKPKRRMFYYQMLDYYVMSCANNVDYAVKRTAEYREIIIGNEQVIPFKAVERIKIEKKFVRDFFRKWKRRFRLNLVCDLAIVVFERSTIEKVLELMMKLLSKRKQNEIQDLLDVLYGYMDIPVKYAEIKELIVQFRINRHFNNKPETRVMVTATMSAGKSTLINAIIGKSLVPMSQGVCTTTLSYVYNKSFEDGKTHLFTETTLDLDALPSDIKGAKDVVTGISTYFNTSYKSSRRICIIDTPGVNSSQNQRARTIARKALKEESYDILIYVLNANYLGTNEDAVHLRYVYENALINNVIFVLNKVDCFDLEEDSIQTSVEDITIFLQEIGFNNPLVITYSAHFSMLAKMKRNNATINEGALDILTSYMKLFDSSEYDLSSYNSLGHTYSNPECDDLLDMLIKSGECDLELLLLGAE